MLLLSEEENMTLHQNTTDASPDIRGKMSQAAVM